MLIITFIMILHIMSDKLLSMLTGIGSIPLFPCCLNDYIYLASDISCDFYFFS